MMKLKCCGKVNPLGVDKQNIRLSFTLDGSLEIAQCRVTLYRADTEQPVYSAPVKGMTHWIPPENVEELTAYLWHIDAVTPEGRTVTSERARFETGPDTWHGKWIQGPDGDDRVLVFRKNIRLDAPVKRPVCTFAAWDSLCRCSMENGWMNPGSFLR